MVTQSAMRMVEIDQTQKWPPKASAVFNSSLKDTAVDELGFLLKRQELQGDQTQKSPNRSGSAPPSMEGSLAAITNLLAQQETSSEVLSRAFEKYDSEEEIRSDPAYLAYYFSNINLNPRLPPPLISRENRHLVRRFGGYGENLRSTSWDNIDENKSLHPSRGALSTHKEETEDEKTDEQSLDGLAEKNITSLIGRHKSLVDLIQEDFPRTPSPVYNQSCSSSSHPMPEDTVDPLVHSIPSEASSRNVLKLPKSDSVDICADTNIISLVCNEDHFRAAIQSSQKDNTRIKGNSQDDYDPSGMKNIQEEPQSYGSKVLSGQAQRMSVSHGVTENVIHGYPRLSSADIQSSLQSHGLAPPLYTTTAAFMTSAAQFYPNFQPSSLYAPQYSMAGYPMGSAVLPQYMAGYTSQGTVPMPFDVSPSSSYSPRSTGVTMMDPLQMQYFQNSLGDGYGSSFQYGPTGSNGDSFAQKDPSATVVGYQKLQPPTNGGFGFRSPRHMGVSGAGYYGEPSSISVMPQYPASPLTSPVLPSSPVGGMGHFGRRNEMRYPQGTNRNTGVYPGWQGHRGVNSVDDPKRHSFLEELKSTNARKFELSDIASRIVEFSVDQHGSRFIQQKLEHCSDEEKASVFKEVLPHASKLMTDVFGNYVIQKFLEHGNSEQKRELANQLVGQMLSLSLQMYGCRVIQKALEVMELDKKSQLVHELDGHVMRCVRDQNGNHVIQKCIESVPMDRIEFIISSFQGQVATLSTHPYGCRVIQRILEHCSDDAQTRCIIDEILESAFALAHDQYGNYVTQHVLERGKPHERSQIISKLTGNIVQMSQHKYASNVVEKCLEHADSAEQELLIEEIIGKSDEDNHLLAMMKDQFANYVVQKVLEISEGKQREVLLDRIKIHLQALRKYTYGKHIVTRFEQLFGEDGEAVEEGA